MIRSISFLFAFLSTTTCTLLAQTFTETLPIPYTPILEGITQSAIAFADIDGDGDLDLLLTGLDTTLAPIADLYLNDGLGRFSATTAPFEGVAYSAVAFADIDGDDDPDLLLTGLNDVQLPVTKLYRNHGMGNFNEVGNASFEAVSRGAIAFADVDDDQDLDLLITGRNNDIQPISKLYLNNGAGHFTEDTNFIVAGVSQSAVAFEDVDGENGPDLILTGQDSASQAITKLYLNDSSGGFVESAASNLVGVREGSIAFADVDHMDGPDLFISGQSNMLEPTANLFTNDSTGHFFTKNQFPFEGVSYGEVAFADIDNDNALDLYMLGQFTDELLPIDRLYRNDGMATFSILLDTAFNAYESSSVAFADVDNDNDPDLYISAVESPTSFKAILLKNDGAGNFSQEDSSNFISTRAGNIVFVDVNGDNSLDLATIGADSIALPTFRIYFNDGMGHFSDNTNLNLDTLREGQIAFADIDGDGDQDLFARGQGSVSNQFFTLMFINDGMGNYTETSNSDIEAFPYGSIAFADVNGDDAPDLFTGAKLYLNDGMGNFTESANNSFTGTSFGSIAFTDIDNDNDQDLFISGGSSDNQRIAKLYINDGLGDFTEFTDFDFQGVSFSAIAFADVDGDNDQDLLLTGQDSPHSGVTKLYINNGVDQSLIFSGPVCTAADTISIGGASPEGGIFSGTGVADDGNGQTFTFDVGSLGPGIYPITYTLDGTLSTANLTVLQAPDVAFTAPGPFQTSDGPQPLSGGIPSGGTYSGMGVSDNGDGTYSFAPSIGAGTYPITYTVMGSNGCSNAAIDSIVVNMAQADNDFCAEGAGDINALFGQEINVPQTSALFNNNGYGTEGDPDSGFDCFEDNQELHNTAWFTFMGNGMSHRIRAIECDAQNYIGNTQAALYTGSCDDLAAVDCNENEDHAGALLNFSLEIPTEANVPHYLMVDGHEGNEGDFCIEVTNLGPVSVTDIQQADISIFPNPTSGKLYLASIEAERVDCFNHLGQLLRSTIPSGSHLDMSGLPAGMYLLRIETKDGVYSARVVKE